MKRFLAILLSLMLLMSALMVPMNISAEGIDWSAELEDRYDFDFTNEFYFSGDNDFYNAAEGQENTVGMDCFHEEQYIILSFCPILSNTYAYGNEYNNATVHDIIDLAKERQGGESLEFKIHSIKLYQKAGESINFH